MGYDQSLNRALYKALKASGLRVSNYGTVFATIANEDKDAALLLIKKFYDLGFNIEATLGTAKYLKEHGIKTRIMKKISEGFNEIIDAIHKGYVTYVINTTSLGHLKMHKDGVIIRRAAIDHNVPVLTCLDTVNDLLNVLGEITIGVSTIDEE